VLACSNYRMRNRQLLACSTSIRDTGRVLACSN
jgi:hypothetical protein